jgi:hypothetical protein
MHSDSLDKVWINPWKYWAATEKMSEAEAGSLMNEVLQCIESGNKKGLERYDFVTIDNPVQIWRNLRSKGNPGQYIA